jgi:predicted nucleotidyltransferase
MIRPRTNAKSRNGSNRAADLVLPPPLPPRPRGKKRPPLVEEIVCRLAPLCRRHGITRLEVFGSVARGEARVGSDVDLIATFPEHPGLVIVSIEEECGRLLGVPVHLLTSEAADAMTNPYRKETIQRDRRTIYDLEQANTITPRVRFAAFSPPQRSGKVRAWHGSTDFSRRGSKGSRPKATVG